MLKAQYIGILNGRLLWYCAVCRYENKEVIKLDKIHIIMSGTPCKKYLKRKTNRNIK